MKRKFAFLVWWVGITVASFLPGDSFPNQTVLFPGADKAVHVVMYAGLAVLASVAFSSGKSKQTAPLMIGLIAYGLLIEILQPILSSRTFEWPDIAANTLGVTVGILIASIHRLRCIPATLEKRK